jgi:hypothetical protein
MERQRVVSGNIKSAGYDIDGKTLEIEFLSGGIYQYYNVPAEIYKELLRAQSCGKYFHRNIKDVFRCRKIR